MTIHNLSIFNESTGKITSVQAIDDSVTVAELLEAYARQVNIPTDTHGVFIRKLTHKQLKPTETLQFIGITDGETLIADFEQIVKGSGSDNKSTISQNNPSLSVIFGDEIVKKSSIYPNLSQEFIITTTDKVKISLIEFQRAINAKNDWITPFGILLALISSLIAADFKRFLGLDPNVWQAIFIIGSAVCLFWLIRAIIMSIRLRGRSEMNYVICQLKQSADMKKTE